MLQDGLQLSAPCDHVGEFGVLGDLALGIFLVRNGVHVNVLKKYSFWNFSIGKKIFRIFCNIAENM
jgi:hypothetical protein